MKSAGVDMTDGKTTHQRLTSIRNVMAGAIGISMFAFTSTNAFAAGTLAGTDIVNVAQASYDGPDGPVTIDSNEVTIKVDELLDVTTCIFHLMV